MSHIFSLKRCHWILLNWKWKYKYMLAHFFHCHHDKSLLFILFCKLNESGMFCFSRNLAATLFLPLITLIITWNGYSSLLSNMYRLLYFGRKEKSTLINYCFCSFQLSPLFSFSLLFFWKILGKIAALSFFLITSFLSCCSFVMLYSDCCFKGHPYQ